MLSYSACHEAISGRSEGSFGVVRVVGVVWMWCVGSCVGLEGGLDMFGSLLCWGCSLLRGQSKEGVLKGTIDLGDLLQQRSLGKTL